MGTSLAAIGTAVVLAAAATLYGTLDDAGHPTLALGGAMALAAGATLAPLLPVRRAPDAIPRIGSTPPGLFAIAWGSAQSALIHLAVIPQHFEEYWLYGWFFIFVGLAQLASAYLVLAHPRRWMLVAIAFGDLAIAGVWVLSRTYGALIGPDATAPARAGFGDIVVTILEVVIAIVALSLSRRPGTLRRERNARGRELANIIASLALTLVSMLALYSTVGGEPFVTHVG